MKNTAKKMMMLCGLAIAIMVVALLMKSSALGIQGAGDELKRLSIKMSLTRVVCLGLAMLLLWKPIAKQFASYFRMDIGHLQFRVLGWYLAAEAAVIASLYGL